MSLRLAACFACLALLPTAGFGDTINLRRSCSPWEGIPSSDTLKNPVSALLFCSNEEKTWLSIQIMCIPKTAEIEIRYRPSFAISTPLQTPPDADEPAIIEVAESTEPQTDAVPETNAEALESTLTPLGQKEMLFFNLPRIGVTSVVRYDFDAKDWSYREKEPLVPLFRSLIRGRYVDVSLLATTRTERLPLRGSTKAIGPVVEACRVAKDKLNKEAEQALQQD